MKLFVSFLVLSLTSAPAFARTCAEVQQDLFKVATDLNTHNMNGMKAIQSYLSQAQQVKNSIQQSLADVGNGSSDQFPGMVIRYRFKSIVQDMYLNPMIDDLSAYSVRFLQNRQPTVNSLNMLTAELSNCTR